MNVFFLYNSNNASLLKDLLFSVLQWVEASYNDNEGNPLRIYTSCYVTQTNVNNWLRTPFIDRKDANRLYIDIRFSMRKCIRHKDPQRLQQCKETFVLYYYEAESDFANAMMPTWDPETYFKMDVIAADYLYEDENDIRINVETKSIPITRQGVYFAIQDTGACISLISIKVYYITCPNITQNYALFMETPTGPDLTSVVQKQGQCVANAAEEKRPTYLCKGGGTWALLDGGCKCMPGYQATPSQTCVGEYRYSYSLYGNPLVYHIQSLASQLIYTNPKRILV